MIKDAIEASTWKVTKVYASAQDLVAATLRSSAQDQLLVLLYFIGGLVTGLTWTLDGNLIAAVVLAGVLFAIMIAQMAALQQRDAEHAEVQRVINRLAVEQPDGAPKVAQVRCGRNGQHTFVYGENGWQEINAQPPRSRTR